MRKTYQSDLSDSEWARIEPHLPSLKLLVDLGFTLLARSWTLSSTCSVVAVPGVYCRTTSRPGRPSITTYFRIWRIDGVWEQLNTALRERLRVRLERNPQPSAGTIDSQSAKTTGWAASARLRPRAPCAARSRGFELTAWRVPPLRRRPGANNCLLPSGVSSWTSRASTCLQHQRDS